MNKIKNKTKSTKKTSNNLELESVRLDLIKKLNDFNQEDGASSWLTTLPIKDEGYVTTKQIYFFIYYELDTVGRCLAYQKTVNAEHHSISNRHHHVRRVALSCEGVQPQRFHHLLPSHSPSLS